MTILELVAVIGVLSILAGISIPRIGDFIAYSRIDEAKALLNTAAADCLQKIRSSSEDKNEIDPSIISDKRVNTIGYEIDKSNNLDECDNFQLVPLDEDDTIRFPIGFAVDQNDGTLSKFATPTSDEAGSIRSCEQWAGINCSQDERLQELIQWKNSIAEAKSACEEGYDQWLDDGTNPTQFQRWNPNAEAGCPSSPPEEGSASYKTATCTTNGCNRIVYGLDGEFAGFTEEDYQRALEDKYGAACAEWTAAKKLARYRNNPPNEPQTLNPECGSQEFWFYDGIDVGSKEKFNERLCEENLEDEKNNAGERRVQGCGEQTYYFCENTIKDSEREFKECLSKDEKFKQAQKGVNGAYSTSVSGCDGCGNFWICDGEILNTQEIYNDKCVQPKSQSKPSYCDQRWAVNRAECQE